MKVVIQRVRDASVTVDGAVTGAIGPGLLLLVGVAHGDNDAVLRAMASKIVNLRIFEDEAGRMNRSPLNCQKVHCGQCSGKAGPPERGKCCPVKVSQSTRRLPPGYG